MATFKLPDAEHGKGIAPLIKRVMREHHEALAKAKVQVDVLLVFAKTDDQGNPVEDPLKHHGYPAIATIKIRPAKERAQRMGDVLLTIDWVSFSTLEPPEQEAVIDHELCHLRLKMKDNDSPKLDDYGRPKLEIKLHDRQFGWFDAVAERHGAMSIEVQQASVLTGDLRQTYLPNF